MSKKETKQTKRYVLQICQSKRYELKVLECKKCKKCSWVSLVGAVQQPVLSGGDQFRPRRERNQPHWRGTGGRSVTERAALPPRRQQTTGESWQGSNNQRQCFKASVSKLVLGSMGFCTGRCWHARKRMEGANFWGWADAEEKSSWFFSSPTLSRSAKEWVDDGSPWTPVESQQWPTIYCGSPSANKVYTKAFLRVQAQIQSNWSSYKTVIWQYRTGSVSQVFSGGSPLAKRCHSPTGRASKPPRGRTAVCPIQRAWIQWILDCSGKPPHPRMNLDQFWFQVTATWIEDHVTAPVWLFLRHPDLFLWLSHLSSWYWHNNTDPRKDQLPERGNAQWTDAFYRGRRSSRIQVDTGLAEPDPISSLAHICQVSDAGPGTYYLLLECRQKLNNLGLTLTLGDTDYLRCNKIQLHMLETHHLQKNGGVEEWPAWCHWDGTHQWNWHLVDSEIVRQNIDKRCTFK